ncbi:hypothetical protein BFL38_09090 [Brachyspira hampsonii]|uniref:Peptidase M30 n=1 Tax=Brachyspira hampsonii TaxID=1287055 RepID=A0A1E5NFP0_9SPIR|nr:hypothetical protein [Brachyspira hampsonii]OEJ14975.1 hypothetical protein BFL38_09090 [Brachyspira hampsonii]
MKTFYLFLFIVFMFIVSCGNKVTSPSETIGNITYYNPAYSETKEFPFWQFDRLGNYNETRAKFSKIVESEHTIVYLQDGYNITREKVISFFTEFENNYKKEIEIYGNHSDLDGNGKIIFLMAELNINIRPEDSVLMGYFAPNDITEGKDGVRGEFLYIDVVYINETTIGFIMHEFQHLINYNVNVLEGKKEPDIWFNEMLSESTSHIFSKYLTDERLAIFNIIPIYSFYSWYLRYTDGQHILNDNKVIFSYASASVFSKWLDMNTGGNYNIYKELANSSPKLSSEERLVSTVKKLNSNLGNDMNDMLINWLKDINDRKVPNASLIVLESSSGNLFPLVPKAAILYETVNIPSIADSQKIKTKDLGNGYSIILNTLVNAEAGLVDRKDVVEVRLPQLSALNSSSAYQKYDLDLLPKRHYFIDRVITEKDIKYINK